MLSYIVQFVTEYLTGGGRYVGDNNDDKSKVYGKEENEQENIENISEDSNCLNSKNFDGTVTSFFNNRGLINDEIYFTQSVVIGNDQPKVGDNVFVKASRAHAEGGWVASSIQITSLWSTENDEKDLQPSVEIIIGSVIDVLGNNAKVKIANASFDVSLVKFKAGFKPYRGDLINIEVWNKKETDNFGMQIMHNNSIISISPLREKRIHGIVTEICQRYGFINDNTYFPFAACQKGFYMNKGDSVIATVIESKQQRGDWRAVYVEQKRKLKEDKSKDANMKTPSSKNTVVACDSSKNGIVVKSELKFGDILTNEKGKMNIELSNIGPHSQTFIGIQTSMEVPGFVCKCERESSIRDEKQCSTGQGTILHRSMAIYPNEKKVLPVEFTPVNIGKIEFSVIFSFDGGFNVGCVVSANVIDDLQSVIAEKGGSYKRPQTFLGRRINSASSSSTSTNVLPGQRPVRKKKFFLPNKLARYPIPSYLKECLVNTDGDVELLVPELSQPLHISNYRKKLSTLLYAEEIQMDQEMRQFDLFNVILRKTSEYLSLQVPGLAEGRPSLLLGDSVVVAYSEKESSSRYEGFIHEIRAEDVLLKFCEDFHNRYQHQNVDVQFHFNRTPYRRGHQAIEHALNMGEETLFPTKVSEKAPLVDTVKNGIKPFNKNLNERQIKAVRRILAATARPVPYVLFGPPGTGKSVTVVEAILQVLKNIKHSRILACAPSNSAADLIAERLHGSGILKKHDMVRLNAFQRSKVAMPECINQYCVSDVDDLQFVSRHRIIVATCNMSGFLYSFNLKVGHFTHIFVDEAGQAKEPECMIPVGFAVGSDEAQVVLAGDPFQLGPVLRSDVAQDYGLNISLLERLTSSTLYERNEMKYKMHGSYNPFVVTKLVNNYRSHAKLLQLPSSIFYHRELMPCAEKSLVDVFIDSDILPNGKCPFVFHGVRGQDSREGNSPSWFNPAEAVEVVKYVQRILRLSPVAVEEIGVITPYRKQVEKIRVLLDRFDLSDIKVGSVEEFQGQERQCIIISTVRSNEELIDFDFHHNIGFLSNPKRFNVSITRAQALMVIIGNPIVLCYDPYWCAMLQYAIMNSAYIGSDLPSLNHELVQESFRQALVLLGVHLQGSSNSTLEDVISTTKGKDSDSIHLEQDNLSVLNQEKISRDQKKQLVLQKQTLDAPGSPSACLQQLSVQQTEPSITKQTPETDVIQCSPINDNSSNKTSDQNYQVSFNFSQERHTTKCEWEKDSQENLQEGHVPNDNDTVCIVLDEQEIVNNKLKHSCNTNNTDRNESITSQICIPGASNVCRRTEISNTTDNFQSTKASVDHLQQKQLPPNYSQKIINNTSTSPAVDKPSVNPPSMRSNAFLDSIKKSGEIKKMK